jgi:hypothetical protein
VAARCTGFQAAGSGLLVERSKVNLTRYRTENIAPSDCGRHLAGHMYSLIALAMEQNEDFFASIVSLHLEFGAPNTSRSADEAEWKCIAVPPLS